VRKPIVAGNWKMNKSVGEAVELASGIKIDLADCVNVDVVLCPPFTALKAVGDVISGTVMKLGAQNMHWEKEGAYTGEVCAGMLRDLYCRYVILGHSERRAYFHEPDETINLKVKAAIVGAITPILCVGETLEEREGNKTEQVVSAQVRACLKDVGEGAASIVVAYEPVWAIGTGRTATPEQAQEVHALIRGLLADIFDKKTADSIRIQYGGSMKPGNAKELMSQPDIDGGLIGGAALDAGSFVEIVRAAFHNAASEGN
jgi:triosephosphate isomerase